MSLFRVQGRECRCGETAVHPPAQQSDQLDSGQAARAADQGLLPGGKCKRKRFSFQFDIFHRFSWTFFQRIKLQINSVKIR